MITLYLDTSSSFLYCGLVRDGILLDEIKENLEKNLSTYVVDKMNKMFEKNNLIPKNVDKILVVNGPGSFTGVRVGLTIAKTLAWTLNIKISTLSSLLAMALSSSDADYFVPLIDARRGYVYGGIYDKDGNSVIADSYIKLNTILENASKLEGVVKYITNDDISVDKTEYSPDILKIVDFCSSYEELNPHGIDALYLKATEAEENLHDQGNNN